MNHSLTFSEKPNSLKSDPGKIFSIESKGASVGYLYSHPTYYTLALPGSVDFQHLEEEMLHGLSHLYGKDITITDETARTRLSVALILSPMSENATVDPLGEGGDGLLRCDLRDSINFQQYQRALYNLQYIAFARYDLSTDGQWNGTITSENKNMLTDREPELCCALPPSSPCPRTMLQWLLSHHANISEGIDVETSLGNLDKILGQHR